MYGALWRVLPGPLWLKLICVMILVIGAFVGLMEWFYPEVMAPLMPFNDGTLTNSPATPSGSP